MAERMSIPELLKDERIEKWKPLFDAATAATRTTDGGGKKSLQMLPAHICRTLAERELVVEVVAEHLETGDVERAFAVLIENLDPPPDPHRALQTLCRTDWAQGEEIDVFFYRIKNAGSEAKAPMRLICSVLVGQLPEPVQPSIKEWLGRDEDGEISLHRSREFIRKVKSGLLEKGYKSDFGYRNLGHIAVLCEQVTRQGTQQQQDEEPTDHNIRELPESDVMKVDRYARKTTDTWRGYRGNPTRGFRNHNPTPRARCYICGSDRHLIARCPQKRCPRCGDKGHGLPECNDHKKNVLYTGGGVKDYPETAVVIQVRFNGNPIHVMLDTGAQPSVIDKATLETMNIPYYTKQDKVYGVGKSPIQVCGTLEVEIDAGEGQIIRHRIEVLDTSSRTAILGRDFLANFEEVCFDMQNFRVRLGESWKETATSLQGGQAILRAEVARVTEPDAYGQIFDIDPSRSPSEREDIQAMLERYSEVFAANPKSSGEI